MALCVIVWQTYNKKKKEEVIMGGKAQLAVLLGRLVFWLGYRDWGRHALRSFGRLLLSRAVFSFFNLGSSERRKAMLIFAKRMYQMLSDTLCDPMVPEPVKRGILNPIRSFIAAGIRAKIRDVWGVCLSFFVLDLTFWCNKRCWGCYSNSELCKEGALHPPLEVVRRIVRYMKEKFGVYYVVISGGEPFLRWGVIVTLARENPDVTFMLYTNGDLITQAMIDEMARLGNISVCLSVEGYESEVDGRRGKGHFAKITRLMTALKQAGIVFAISVTVTSKNADVVCSDEFIDYYIKLGAKYAWYFIYIPIGRNPDKTLMVSDAQRDLLSKQTKRWRRLKRILVADFWNDGVLVQGCIAGGRRYVHFKATPQGKLKLGPCVFCPYVLEEDVWGMLSRKDGIMEAIVSSELFAFYRKKQKGLSEHRQNYAPCIVIDSHEDLREVVNRASDAEAHLNTPDGFVDGKLSQEIERIGSSWRTFCQ